MTPEKPYMNPYAAGIGVGLALLAAFVVTGHGLGAMGGLSTAVSSVAATIFPDRTESSVPYAAFVPSEDGSGDRGWLAFQLVGLFLGAAVSALYSGRFRLAVIRGTGISPNQRVFAAFAGGVLMAVGGKLARGCTSGQGLTGGATLSAGAWLFIGCAFAGAYLLAPFLRRNWQP